MGALTEEEQGQFDIVQNSFYEQDALFQAVESFATEHCGVFSLNDNEEQKLEYQEVYLKFKESFESAFERVLAECGVSSDGFQGMCVKLSDESARDKDDTRRWSFLSFVLALGDYDTFALMMRQAKETRSGAQQEV